MLRIKGLGSSFAAPIGDLKEAWQEPLSVMEL
jgi:hypothetical protein